MWCLKPVCGYTYHHQSAVGGIPEIISDGKSGILVPPKDHQRIAQAIEYMMAYKEKAEELGMHPPSTFFFFFFFTQNSHSNPC